MTSMGSHGWKEFFRAVFKCSTIMPQHHLFIKQKDGEYPLVNLGGGGGANFYGMLQWPSRLKRSCNWQHSDSTTSVSKGIYWAMFTGRGNSHFLQSHGGQNFAVGSRGLRLFKRRCKHKPWYFKATPWVTPNRQYKARTLVQCSPYK